MTDPEYRIPVLLSGMPGGMCREIERLIWETGEENLGVNLLPYTFVGDEDDGKVFEIGPYRTMEGIGPTRRRDFDFTSLPGGLIVVDFTEPDVALLNVDFYCEKGFHFVMGTTGFDRDTAAMKAREAGVSAVIAPNMAAPIVMIQLAMESLAERFPGILDGWQLTIRESHQKTKKDTSGTAKALRGHIEKLGAELAGVGIQSIRDEELQKDLGVPEEHLSGHGWHWYEATSPDKTVKLGLSHLVNGRRIYAEGAIRAVKYLAGKLQKGRKGEVYSMIDVLENK